MAAVGITHLYEATQPNDKIGIAYVFCSYKAKFEQSASALFAALLKQLAQTQPDIMASVKALHDKHRGGRASPDEIYKTLQSACAAYATIYLIVDALDEYEDRDSIHLKLIDKLLRLQAGADVRIMFTSRLIPTIVDKLKSALTLEVRASEEDVRRFVEGQLEHLPRCIHRDQDLQDKIVSQITEAADGM